MIVYRFLQHNTHARKMTGGQSRGVATDASTYACFGREAGQHALACERTLTVLGQDSLRHQLHC